MTVDPSTIERVQQFMDSMEHAFGAPAKVLTLGLQGTAMMEAHRQSEPFRKAGANWRRVKREYRKGWEQGLAKARAGNRTLMMMPPKPPEPQGKPFAAASFPATAQFGPAITRASGQS